MCDHEAKGGVQSSRTRTVMIAFLPESTVLEASGNKQDQEQSTLSPLQKLRCL